MNLPKISNKYFLGALIPNVRIFSETIDAIIASFDKSTVTQITSITTGVTINAPAGVITTVALTTAAGAVSGPFTVTNSNVKSDSVILTQVEYAAGKTGAPLAIVEGKTAGSFKIKIANGGSAVLNDIVKVHYFII